jgi:hypothetical protein
MTPDTDERTGMVTEEMVEAAMLKLGPLFNYYNDGMDYPNFVRAALSAALAIPDAKPDAWAYEIDYEDLRGWQRHIWFEKPEPSPRVRNVRPLYATPASSQTELAEARRLALEEAASLIDANIVQDTSSGKVLKSRQDGNRDGLAYASAIRALASMKER